MRCGIGKVFLNPWLFEEFNDLTCDERVVVELGDGLGQFATAYLCAVLSHDVNEMDDSLAATFCLFVGVGVNVE